MCIWSLCCPIFFNIMFCDYILYCADAENRKCSNSIVDHSNTYLRNPHSILMYVWLRDGNEVSITHPRYNEVTDVLPKSYRCLWSLFDARLCYEYENSLSMWRKAFAGCCFKSHVVEHVPFVQVHLSARNEQRRYDLMTRVSCLDNSLTISG